LKTKSNRIIPSLLLVVLCTAAPLAQAKGASSKGKSSGGNSSAPATPNIVDQIMQKYDMDHDGQLSTDEIRAMAAADPTNAQTAKQYDVDHDYVLSASEIAAWHNAAATKSKAPAKTANGNTPTSGTPAAN
jgi:hypothetical protein